MRKRQKNVLRATLDGYDWYLRHKLERKFRDARELEYRQKITASRKEAAKRTNRPCCSDIHNLRYAPLLNNRKDTVILKCKHCHAIHRSALADTVKIKAG